MTYKIIETSKSSRSGGFKMSCRGIDELLNVMSTSKSVHIRLTCGDYWRCNLCGVRNQIRASQLTCVNCHSDWQGD